MKANQPSLGREVAAFFAEAPPAGLDTDSNVDKGHGRIEERTVTVAHEVDWLTGERRFPGERRLPDIKTLIRVATRTELKDRSRLETRYYVSSAVLTAARAQHAVRSHWAIENRLHWVMDVVFKDDQCRLRKGYGAKNMAVVRHFALNLVRAVAEQEADQTPPQTRRLEPRLPRKNPPGNPRVNLDSKPWGVGGRLGV